MAKTRVKIFRTSSIGLGIFFHNIVWLKGVTLQVWNFNFAVYKEDLQVREGIISGGDFS